MMHSPVLLAQKQYNPRLICPLNLHRKFFTQRQVEIVSPQVYRQPSTSYHLSLPQHILHTGVFFAIKTGIASRVVKPVVSQVAHNPRLWFLKPITEKTLEKTLMQVFLKPDMESALKEGERRLKRGQGAIFDYAAPELPGQKQGDYDRVYAVVEKLIQEASNLKASYPGQHVSVALKVSNLADPTRLEQNEDTEAARHVTDRVLNLLRLAKDKNIKCVLDAEWEAINPVVENIWMRAVEERLPAVGTIQAYLKRSEAFVDQLLKKMDRLNKDNPEPHIVHVKQVRGAYMNRPGERPFIHDTENETHANYHKLMAKLAGYKHVDTLIFATHNKESYRRTVELVSRSPLSKIYAATLDGMSEGLSKTVQDPELDNYRPEMIKYIVFARATKDEDLLTNVDYLLRRFDEGASDKGREFDAIWGELKERIGF